MSEPLPWLTDDEVRELTGYVRPTCQKRWLVENGIRCFMNGKGKVRVPREPATKAFSGTPEFCLPPVAPPPSEVQMLSLQEIGSLPSADGKGIYFLWRGKDLLYIGKSECISRRIRHHHYAWRFGSRSKGYDKEIPFDRFTSLVLSESPIPSEQIAASLRLHERAYIAEYQPPYNHDGENPGT